METTQKRNPSLELGPKQAAYWLGVSVRTMEDWRARGEGPPYYKVGGAIRYSIAELEAWFEGRRVIPERPYGPKMLTGRNCRRIAKTLGPSSQSRNTDA
ncbi:hypothetical protein PbB2_02948 [Candidatus Phycosocius bacilliformis]|uniref:Helix-turn-helix domain-containing protein n=1 Tax=Candidatus Phycosocius bacilliformis TaxID=1445552 RepID=A0A2P2EDX1_9PROT|nr:helix-turn-helix domain-containing protein [Candidatus Phycosocius bacilliformis]GBF59256.1 hypothetical protein PbB2_02948 [Candidatus Phycosocius bacilliformis]